MDKRKAWTKKLHVLETFLECLCFADKGALWLHMCIYIYIFIYYIMLYHITSYNINTYHIIKPVLRLTHLNQFLGLAKRFFLIYIAMCLYMYIHTRDILHVFSTPVVVKGVFGTCDSLRWSVEWPVSSFESRVDSPVQMICFHSTHWKLDVESCWNLGFLEFSRDLAEPSVWTTVPPLT